MNWPHVAPCRCLVSTSILVIVPVVIPASLPRSLRFLTAMEPITQDKRVSQGHNGDLYFSNVMLPDMQTDYSCNARFHFTHTIQQKDAFTLKVLTSECGPLPGAGSRGWQPAEPTQPREPGAGGALSPRLTEKSLQPLSHFTCS